MPLKSPEPVQYIPFIQQSFAGGINTAVPPELVLDTQAVDILNHEYDMDDHLVARAGVSLWSNDSFTKRITSLHYYANDVGDVFVLMTTGSKVYASTVTSPSFVDITGSLVLPNDTFWMWKNYAGIAIGVNKATTGNNPIKVSGAVPTAAALGGTPPKARYIEVWNERVWLVKATDPNTIQASALGNPEDWTTAGDAGTITIDIGKNDGDQITGLIAFRERLFVFKRKRIYEIRAIDGTVPTASSNLMVALYASNIGCVSPYSIKNVLDDVLFLSDVGVCSLVSAPLGEFKSVVISQNVKEIQHIHKTSSEITAYVAEENNQYWLLVPDNLSPRGVNEIYVMDYRKLQDGVVRWIRFDGTIAGTVTETIYVSGQRLTLIGSGGRIYSYDHSLTDVSAMWDSGTWDVSKWDVPISSNFADNEVPFQKLIVTKAFNYEVPLTRKLFHKFGVGIFVLSESVKLDVRYMFDKLLSFGDSYLFDCVVSRSGGIWDSSLWDSGTWDNEIKRDVNIIRGFKRSARGRKAQNVSFIISNNLKEGYVFKELLIEAAILNDKRTNNIGVL